VSKNKLIPIVLILLCLVDIFLWVCIFKKPCSEVSFLNVGQGDSTLLNFENKVQVLIDAGPSAAVLSDLSKNLPFYDRYIDLVILSHPEKDHFYGLFAVLDSYNVGAFIFNGVFKGKLFDKLISKIKHKKIPIIVLKQNDRIIYGENQFKVLWPKDIQGLSPNESSLVLKFVNPKMKILFAGDISSKTEQKISDLFDVKSDVLKAAHHGSKYSSCQTFLDKVMPKISVISVGKNTYGHPSKEIISRMRNLGAQVYTTLRDGTIKLKIGKGVKIFKQK